MISFQRRREKCPSRSYWCFILWLKAVETWALSQRHKAEEMNSNLYCMWHAWEVTLVLAVLPHLIVWEVFDVSLIQRNRHYRAERGEKQTCHVIRPGGCWLWLKRNGPSVNWWGEPRGHLYSMTYCFGQNPVHWYGPGWWINANWCCGCGAQKPNQMWAIHTVFLTKGFVRTSSTCLSQWAKGVYAGAGAWLGSYVLRSEVGRLAGSFIKKTAGISLWEHEPDMPEPAIFQEMPQSLISMQLSQNTSWITESLCCTLKLARYYKSTIFQLTTPPPILARRLSVYNPWIRTYSCSCGFLNKEMPNFLFSLYLSGLLESSTRLKPHEAQNYRKKALWVSWFSIIVTLALAVAAFSEYSESCWSIYFTGVAGFILWLLWDALLLLVDYYWWINFFLMVT